MQLCNAHSPQYNHPQTNLNKIASMPSFQPVWQTNCVQRTLEPNIIEGYWKKSIKFILKMKKSIKISKGSLFLAISYLGKLVFEYAFQLNENNYQKVSICLILISAKMLEIYPPKISTLLSKCSKFFKKEDLVQIQGEILHRFNFDMSFTQTGYSYMYQYMENQNQDKLQDAQKLLGLALSDRKIAEYGEHMIVLAIINLMKPSLLRDIGYGCIHDIRNVASKIYSLYLANKAKN